MERYQAKTRTLTVKFENGPTLFLDYLPETLSVEYLTSVCNQIQYFQNFGPFSFVHNNRVLKPTDLINFPEVDVIQYKGKSFSVFRYILAAIIFSISIYLIIKSKALQSPEHPGEGKRAKISWILIPAAISMYMFSYLVPIVPFKKSNTFVVILRLFVRSFMPDFTLEQVLINEDA